MANRKVVPGPWKKPNLHRRKRKQRKIKMMHFQPHFSCKHKEELKVKEKLQKKKPVAQTCTSIQEKGLIICHKTLSLHANISQMLQKTNFMDGDGNVPIMVSNASIDICYHKVIKLFQRSKGLKRKLKLSREDMKNRKQLKS